MTEQDGSHACKHYISGGKTATMKRRRDQDWWAEAVTWVRDNGGMVHSGISVNDRRELIVDRDIAKGELLMEIPRACLPSGDAIRSTEIGKRIADCIASVTEELYSADQDLLVALMLAQDGACSPYQPYLGTLPEGSSFDLLPRLWSKAQKILLQGSCLLERVEKADAAIEKDYQLICRKWTCENPLPSFEKFTTMLAAVTSRAFAGMGATEKDEDIAMVPLLDLCNHHRGQQAIKNVSYQRHESAVRATAFQPLESGAALQITYGAKGNAQLLFNYGFCIPHNLEPDGSSNDVVEVLLKNDNPVQLRTGPKSYTFGCLSRAVEQFHKQHGTTTITTDDDDGPVSLEDFLDDCDANPGVCGFTVDEEEETEDEHDDEDRTAKAECDAIGQLQSCLTKVRSRYRLQGSELQGALSSDDPHRRYSAILIHSELRTIQFYELACVRISEKLLNEETTKFKWDVLLESTDEGRLEHQAAELSEAFVRIRCQDFS